MKNAGSICRAILFTFAIAGFMALGAERIHAQTLQPNQTFGFGNERLLTLTYLQSFDCVDEPNLDLDFSGKPAQSDPNEMQVPICQAVTEPQHDPTGGNLKHTAPLYVLVPMFSVNNDTNPDDAMPCPNGGRPGELCGRALGQTLIALFGAVPEAFKSHPLVTTQCPDPGSAPGTCTMHSSSIDLSKVLVALGKIPGPPKSPIFLPTPNHSHIVDNSDTNDPAIWWEVRPVLILHQSDWPSADGSRGLTSAKAMDEAEKAGRAIEVGSNFFLFFSTKFTSAEAAQMLHQHHGPEAVSSKSAGTAN
jgi:hypothetical protein